MQIPGSSTASVSGGGAGSHAEGQQHTMAGPTPPTSTYIYTCKSVICRADWSMPGEVFGTRGHFFTLIRAPGPVLLSESATSTRQGDTAVWWLVDSQQVNKNGCVAVRDAVGRVFTVPLALAHNRCAPSRMLTLLTGLTRVVSVRSTPCRPQTGVMVSGLGPGVLVMICVANMMLPSRTIRQAPGVCRGTCLGPRVISSTQRGVGLH